MSRQQRKRRSGAQAIVWKGRSSPKSLGEPGLGPERYVCVTGGPGVGRAQCMMEERARFRPSGDRGWMVA
eukprot:570144-Pyramimonas_sp.AAC.3